MYAHALADRLLGVAKETSAELGLVDAAGDEGVGGGVDGLERVRQFALYRRVQHAICRDLQLVVWYQTQMQSTSEANEPQRKPTWSRVFRYLDRAATAIALLPSGLDPSLLKQRDAGSLLVNALKRRAAIQSTPSMPDANRERERGMEMAEHAVRLFRSSAVDKEDVLIPDWRQLASDMLGREIGEEARSEEEAGSETSESEETESEEEEEGQTTGVGSRISGFFGSIWGAKRG